MSVPDVMEGAGLSLHVSSRTTVRASTKVSRMPAGPDMEPVQGAASGPVTHPLCFLGGTGVCGAWGPQSFEGPRPRVWTSVLGWAGFKS